MWGQKLRCFCLCVRAGVCVSLGALWREGSAGGRPSSWHPLCAVASGSSVDFVCWHFAHFLNCCLGCQHLPLNGVLGTEGPAGISLGALGLNPWTAASLWGGCEQGPTHLKHLRWPGTCRYFSRELGELGCALAHRRSLSSLWKGSREGLPGWGARVSHLCCSAPARVRKLLRHTAVCHVYLLGNIAHRSQSCLLCFP